MACRMCLSVPSNRDTMNPISEVYSSVITTFPAADLRMSQDPIICSPCLKRVQAFSQFKKTVLSNESKIKTYRIGLTNDATSGIKRVYAVKLSEVLVHYDLGGGESGPSDESACRLCFNHVKLEESINLKKNNIYHDSLLISLPEVNLNYTQKAVACYDCGNKLKDLNEFQTRCSEVQKRLQSYLTTEGQVLTDKEFEEIARCYSLSDEKPDMIERNTTCSEEKNIKTLIPQPSENKEQVITKMEKGQDEPVYRCSYCIYSSLVEASLIFHMKYKHKVYDKELEFKCDLCLYQSPNKSDLKRHVRHKHKKAKNHS